MTRWAARLMVTAAALAVAIVMPTTVGATLASCPVPPGSTGVTDVGCANELQLDGNIPHDSLTTPPWDWAKGTAGQGGVMNNDGSAVSNGITGAIVNSGVIADYAQPDTSYFAQNKDIQDSSAWGCVSQSQPTPKDDLLNAYAVVFQPASGPRAGHRILYVGSERQQNQGNAFAGFWLLQNPTSCSPTANGGSFQTTGHSTNDFLLLANYTNGGTIAALTVLRWDPTATNNLAGVTTSTDCQDVDSSANVCGRVNSVPQTPPWPNSSGSSVAEPAGDFVEIGIDMTALGLDHTAGGQTLCSSSFLAETRSSQEATATLKDYALGAFDICRRPTVATSVDGNGTASVDAGASVFDTATLSGASPTASGTVTYNLYAGSVCTGTPVFTSTKTVTNGAVPNSDPWTAVSGTYQWQATYSGDLATGGIDQGPVRSGCGAEPLTVIAPTVTPSPSPSPAVVVVQAAAVTPAATGDRTIFMVLGAPLLLLGLLLLLVSRKRREIDA